MKNVILCNITYPAPHSAREKAKERGRASRTKEKEKERGRDPLNLGTPETSDS